MMNTEKLNLPLKEDGRFDDFGNYRKKTSRKIQIFIGVTFLVVINISLFVLVVYTLTRVKNLENEIDVLQSTVSQVKRRHDDLYDAIGFQDEDLYEEDQDMDAQTEPEMFIAKPEEPIEYSEYDYDQVLNDTEEDKPEDYQMGSRQKRGIVAATRDGVLINSESYAEKKARNGTRNRAHTLKGFSVTPVSSRPSYYGPTPWINSRSYEDSATYKYPTRPPLSVYIRRSRVMHTEDRSKAFRQVVKKSSLKSGDTYNTDGDTPEGEFTIIRDDQVRRRTHSRVGRIRLTSAHFSGDTSRYIVGQHTNFNGNGHLRHPQRTFVDWKVSDWVKSAGMDAHFTLEDGVVTIKEPGIYFIYAQVYYLDEHDTTGFRVHKNRDIILQCTITGHSSERRLKGNTCYTAGAEYLSEGDTISLADVTDGRYSLFEPGKSFFGLIKLGDIKIN